VFIDRQRGDFPVKRMCALYGVTHGGYYAWRHRGESARREQDRGLLRMIQTRFETSRGTYVSPRIHHALRAAPGRGLAGGASRGSCARPGCGPER
jgi:putative transposase